MAKPRPRPSEYALGYKAGYTKGKREAIKAYLLENPDKTKAYWIVRKDGWYCSGCDTKHEQAHDDFCCKCGAKMSEEADLEDN